MLRHNIFNLKYLMSLIIFAKMKGANGAGPNVKICGQITGV
jgi:hypothetical protein